MNSFQMRVILGVASLKAYVAAPKSFHVIGVVRFGMEFGLLATTPDGLYFRVNGSQVVALSTQAVLRAIDQSYGAGGRFASGAERYALTHPNAAPLPLSRPIVVIRKHRQIPMSAMQNQRPMQSANA